MDGEGDFGNNPNPNLIAEDEESVTVSTLSYQNDQEGESMRRGRRHSAYQIQELQNLFKNDHFPIVEVRKELAQRLNLEPDQVNNWFQNKRAQVKKNEQRHENILLKEDNERLREANDQLKHKLQLVAWYTMFKPTNCGELHDEEQNLRMESAILQQEIHQLRNYLCGLVQVMPNQSVPLQPSSNATPGLGSGVQARTVKEEMTTRTWTPDLG